METFIINIEGLVQGVGFRPFVYKLAASMGLAGTVENRNTGVRILINADSATMKALLERLQTEAPRQSRIDLIKSEKTTAQIFTAFSIVSSTSLSDAVTGISPDIAVCDECLDDMTNQAHRINYPLVNCTNCGPRFSIIKEVPYDRSQTTMSGFTMCNKCRGEYEDVYDRRFHAQPVACNNCGPEYSIVYKGKVIKSINEILSISAEIIDNGGIIALKGTGGYHLLCDAMNDDSVALLRNRKQREGKPFAVMCRDMDTVREICSVSKVEEDALKSWQRPVVILEGNGVVAPSVSNNLGSVGVILPYMPFHYLLFNALKCSVIVFTSANLSEEPVLTEDKEAEAGLDGIADALVLYNREIHNRTDDSVARTIGGDLVLIRRSRGYAPSPVKLQLNCEGVFGAGAELTNCFALGKGGEAILSQHIGDVRNAATLDFYRSAVERFSRMFRFTPHVVTRDMHPDYLSSVFACELAARNSVPVVEVQHHHAHIASCMAENGVSEKVIGVAMDGVGLGTDGNIWGGEFLIADLCGYERVLHFDYIPIAGGDAVSSEPWRSAVALWLKCGGDLSGLEGLPVYEAVGGDRINLFKQVTDKKINTSHYSGAGRIFDAVAALTGISIFSTFHAEAPMRLEAAIQRGVSSHYNYAISGDVISFDDAVRAIVNDCRYGRSPGEISAVFHNTVGSAIVAGVSQISLQSGIRKVALSGGTFQNRYLAEMVINHLLSEKFIVYFHRNVPLNDGGIALGQVAIASARRDKGLINR